MPPGISLACHASAAASAARSTASAHPGTALADIALATALLNDRIARLFAVLSQMKKATLAKFNGTLPA